MRKEELELFRRRAQGMYELAEKALLVGHYDLAAFLAEQAAQLFVKYKVLELTGEVPRTHSLRRLLGMLAEVLGEEDGELLNDFIRKNRSLLIRLEEAYLSSRYLLREYERDEAEELLGIARKVMKLVEDIQVRG